MLFMKLNNKQQLVFKPTLPYQVRQSEFLLLVVFGVFLIGLLTGLKRHLNLFVDSRNRYAIHLLQEAEL